jgi:hypothetical protein
MHERVHERASEQQQPNEYSEDMGAMLSKQERTGNDQKPDEDQACR